MRRLRVGVIYGGRSGEHEVSLASAAAVISNLDRRRYEPVPIRIDRDGRWTIPDRIPTTASAAEAITQARLEAGRATRNTREVHLIAHPSGETILTIDRTNGVQSRGVDERPIVSRLGLDVIFPLLHGPYGEDGTVQGLLELANVPYVGAGVLASAVGMDKAVMKVLFAARSLPITQYEVVLRRRWQAEPQAAVESVLQRLALPVFVKPANLGSSVGISKATTPAELHAAIELAGHFDRKIVIEAAVPRAREIECSVLGNDEPAASIPGEVLPAREFYDYEAKYLDQGSQLLVPAPLTPQQVTDVQRMAIEAFLAIDGSGMARVDFLLSQETGTLYVSEVNTIPGFTTISMYARLWEASGLPYSEMLDRLITLAFERHAEKQQLRTSVT